MPVTFLTNEDEQRLQTKIDTKVERVASINLINPNKLVDGYYVNETNGALVSNNTYYATDYIPVNSGSPYSYNANARYAWYDSDKVYITGARGTFSTNAPDNARYIRASVPKSYLTEAMLTQTATMPLKYIPYYVEIPGLKKGLNVEDFTIGGAYTTVNLFNPSVAVDGKYVLPTSGELSNNASHCASEFIKCKPETIYSANLPFRMAAYDKNYFYLAGTNNEYKYTTPANAEYIRVSTAIVNKNTIMLVEGETLPASYVPYGVVAPWLHSKLSKYHSKKMVCFGDSITSSGYTDTITTDTGIEAINVGMASARYAPCADNVKNAFALHNIVDAICTGDWTIPDSIKDVEGYEVQCSRIELLKSIDFSTVDFVSFAYGTNDYASGTALTSEDPYDIDSVGGALRYAIKTLQTAYPHLRIIVSLPIYRFFTTNGEITSDGDTQNYGGGTLADYCTAIKQAAEKEHIPCVDLYNNGGINAHNRLHYFDISDGTHPNALGREVIGHHIASGVLAYL